MSAFLPTLVPALDRTAIPRANDAFCCGDVSDSPHKLANMAHVTATAASENDKPINTR
jgi:hypothetical protein